MINNNETKLKSHLEITRTNKRKKKEFPSLSLDDKTLYDIYESGLAKTNTTFSSKNKMNFQRNFENVRNSDIRDSSKETMLFPNQQQFPNFFNNEKKKKNCQNVYVNNINITNNFNNMTLNTTSINTVLCDTNDNNFYSHNKFDCENLDNLSNFNDISNFTYSEKPSNRRRKVGSEKESSNIIKSEILNVNLNNNYTYANNSKENFKNNNNNFSNFNNLNSHKKNFVNSDIRNSLNLSSFDKKSFSPMRNADTVIQNKIASRNKFFCESENLKVFNNNNNNYILYSNNNTQISDIPNAVDIKLSNKNEKNNSDNFEFNNNAKNSHYTNFNDKMNNGKNSNYGFNDNKNNSPKNLTNETHSKESNQSSGKTISAAAISCSEKTSSASCFSTSSNNKINLRLILNSEKISYPNIPNNINKNYKIDDNFYKDVGNNPPKNSFFLNFLDKTKNIQTHQNTNNQNTININKSYHNNNNYSNNLNNFEEESFRNSKQLLNLTNQSSNSRGVQYLNNSGFHKNSSNFSKNLNLTNVSLSEARNFQQKQQQLMLNSSKIQINNLGENFGYEVNSPSKRNSEPICFSSSAQGKRPVERHLPGMIKMQINAKIRGIVDFNGNNSSKKVEANVNLEIIKRLSGDDDKDIFGD
jgi:hypothetical protein